MMIGTLTYNDRLLHLVQWRGTWAHGCPVSCLLYQK